MIKTVITKYGNSGAAIELLTKEIERYIPASEYERLAKDIYELSQGKHFDEYFAKELISKMYYEENGIKHYAPYWDDVTSLYTINKKRLIYPYNKWDFEVALNMIKSDNCPLLKEWFPNASKEELQNKIVDLTINWLNDPDNPYGDSKVWGYFKN